MSRQVKGQLVRINTDSASSACCSYMYSCFFFSIPVGFDVTITANNLGIPGTDAVKVTIGEFACVNIIQISSDQITCRVPSGTGIQHRLIVSTEPAAKSSENVFISYDPPRLMAISPSLGAAAGNTIVRLRYIECSLAFLARLI